MSRDHQVCLAVDVCGVGGCERRQAGGVEATALHPRATKVRRVATVGAPVAV